MGILAKSLVGLNTNPIVIYNTGTIFDLAVGEYVYDEKRYSYLAGGLPNAMTGFVGAGQTYKSTIALGMAMGLLSRYPDSDMVVLDGENTLSSNRCEQVCHHAPFPVKDNIVIRGSEGMTIGEAWEIVDGIAEQKEKYRKDLTVELPFLDPATGKKKKGWIPTVIMLDTISELKAKVTKEMIAKAGLDDKKIKTIYMADGHQKTVFNNLLASYAAKYGLVIICCAHIGKNMDMDSYGPPKKQLQYLTQDERLKNVGSNFDRLTRILTRTRAKVLYDGNKECYYPEGHTHANDVNEVSAQIIRNKSGMGSGCTMPLIVSQQAGLLNSMTYYHYLKQQNKFGLDGGNVHKPVLAPDESISRNNAREKFNASYELRRAIEITGQICWIANHWNTSSLPWNFDNSGKDILDSIMTSSNPHINEVLESRGWWTYGKHDRKYMPLSMVMDKVLPKKA